MKPLSLKLPALQRSANEISLEAQRRFLSALRAHLVLLVFAALLSVINHPHWLFAVFQAIVLLLILALSVFLASRRPDKLWYASRALAESVKTLSWRFACRAEPFDSSDEESQKTFRVKLRQIVEQNREIAGQLAPSASDVQVTDEMMAARAMGLAERQRLYLEQRINDQLTWYVKKAGLNKRAAKYAFGVLIAVNASAVLLALFRIQYPNTPLWPTDVFVAASASLLAWMQAKRYSELSSSYALTAHEISLIREQTALVTSEVSFSDFVGDTENAFSREHTQWTARRDK
jgi:hypothetical protein